MKNLIIRKPTNQITDFRNLRTDIEPKKVSIVSIIALLAILAILTKLITKN